MMSHKVGRSLVSCLKEWWNFLDFPATVTPAWPKYKMWFLQLRRSTTELLTNVWAPGSMCRDMAPVDPRRHCRQMVAIMASHLRMWPTNPDGTIRWPVRWNSSKLVLANCLQAPCGPSAAYSTCNTVHLNNPCMMWLKRPTLHRRFAYPTHEMWFLHLRRDKPATTNNTWSSRHMCKEGVPADLSAISTGGQRSGSTHFHLAHWPPWDFQIPSLQQLFKTGHRWPPTAPDGPSATYKANVSEMACLDDPRMMSSP